MKISELPPKIKEKALMYQRNSHSYPCEKETDNLQWAFNWKKTTEGHEYWADLHQYQKKDYTTTIIVIFAIITLLIFTL
jgi:cytochrome b subunit of formate dehydrogenase